MKKLYINLCEQSEEDLQNLMKYYGAIEKSEIIQRIVREHAEKIIERKRKFSFREILSSSLKAPINCNPRFQNEL